jgi:hypothetical protein
LLVQPTVNESCLPSPRRLEFQLQEAGIVVSLKYLMCPDKNSRWHELGSRLDSYSVVTSNPCVMIVKKVQG